MNTINLIFTIIKNIIFSFFVSKEENNEINYIFPDRWQLSEDNAFFMIKYCYEKKIKNFKIVCFKNKDNINLLRKHNINYEYVEWFNKITILKKMASMNKAFYSHSKLHCFPTYFQFKKFFANQYIFINHGIEYFKEQNFKSTKFTHRSSDVLIKVITNKKDSFEDETYFKKIYTSCLFNHYYETKINESNGKSIYFPTWKKFKSYKDFCNSHIIKQIDFLKQQGLVFDVFCHKYIYSFFNKYCKKNNLNIVVEKTIFEIITTYSNCYTDNSSICLDFLLLGKKSFLVNKHLPNYRLSENRKLYLNEDIEEICGINFCKNLDEKILTDNITMPK